MAQEDDDNLTAEDLQRLKGIPQGGIKIQGGAQPISADEARARGYDPTGSHLDPQPQAAQAGGGLMDRWHSFIDHPENRAGMMQFAVNMLAGKGLGESIGSAAEASSRNIASQEEEQKYEDALALKQQEEARKERETTYYGQMASRGSAQDRYFAQAADREERALRMKGVQAFHDWLNEPGGNKTGVMADVIKKYPNITSKADLQRQENGEARDYAAQLHARANGYAPQGSGSGGGQQPVYDKKTGALKGYWDGKKFVPGGPE